MSLIKCSECGKEISSHAKNCPHCGFPISKNNTKAKLSNLMKPLNILSLVFSILMMFAVLQSNGGPSGNANAAALSWFLMVGSIISLYTIKHKNMLFKVVSSICYIASILIAFNSIAIAPAYLILQGFICLTLLINIINFKNVTY